LLSPVKRMSGWQLAEVAGDATIILGWAVWDANEVWNDLLGDVVKYLGTAPIIWVVDEIGLLKQQFSV
jgi:hypothetical protein